MEPREILTGELKQHQWVVEIGLIKEKTLTLLKEQNVKSLVRAVFREPFK